MDHEKEQMNNAEKSGLSKTEQTETKHGSTGIGKTDGKNRETQQFSGLPDSMTKEMAEIKAAINDCSDRMTKLSAICKENIDYCQRYQKNTVDVLLQEEREKTKYIDGLLLVDLLKPIAKFSAKIEKRIDKMKDAADKKAIKKLLEDLHDTLHEEYDVVVERTEPGNPRRENVSHVDGTVVTDDESLNNIVAESLNSSWVLNNRIIMKENVKVYMYVPGSNKEAGENITEPDLAKGDDTEKMMAAETESAADNKQEQSGECAETEKNEEQQRVDDINQANQKPEKDDALEENGEKKDADTDMPIEQLHDGRDSFQLQDAKQTETDNAAHGCTDRKQDGTEPNVSPEHAPEDIANNSQQQNDSVMNAPEDSGQQITENTEENHTDAEKNDAAAAADTTVSSSENTVDKEQIHNEEEHQITGIQDGKKIGGGVRKPFTMIPLPETRSLDSFQDGQEDREGEKTIHTDNGPENDL